MIEVGRMISMMGSTLAEIIEAGLLKPNQKPKPRFSGDDELILFLKLEGVVLAFERSTKKLKQIDLTIFYPDKPQYIFPNELPSPLQHEMTRTNVLELMGTPYESLPPREVLNKIRGGVDHYLLKRDVWGDLSQLITYTSDQKMVRVISYVYTRDVSWSRSG